MFQHYIIGHFDFKELCIVSLPGGRWYFENAGIIDSAVLGIKLGIGPDATQLGVTNIIDIAGVGDVNRITHRRFTSTVGTDLATVGNCNVVCPFVPLATLVGPSLYNLNAIQVP